MDGFDLPGWTMLAPALLYALAMVAAIGQRPAIEWTRYLPSWLTVGGGIVGVAIGVNALLRGGSEAVGGGAARGSARPAARARRRVLS